MKLIPVITEKTLRASVNSVFTFKLAPAMSKPQIKKLIEESFAVHVRGVRTHTKQPAQRKFRKQIGMSKKLKYICVSLKKGERIPGFEQQEETKQKAVPSKRP